MSDPLDGAWMMFVAGKYDRARELTLEVLRRRPNEAAGVALLARCAWEQGGGDAAVADARRAMGLDPTNPFVIDSLARILIGARDADGAMDVVEAGLLQRPDDVDWIALHAWIECMRGEFTQAIATADRGLALDPIHLGALETRAWAQFHANQCAAARSTCEVVLRIDPERAFTHRILGWIAVSEREPEEARARFFEALRLEPLSEHARTGLVTALRDRSPWGRTLSRAASTYPKWRRAMPLLVIVGIGASLRIGGSKPLPVDSWIYTVRSLGVLAVVVGCGAWVLAPGLALMPLLLRRRDEAALDRHERTIARIAALTTVAVIAGVVALFVAHARPKFALISVGLLLFPAAAATAVARVADERTRRRYGPFVALAGLCALAAYAAALFPNRIPVDVTTFAVLGATLGSLLLLVVVRRGAAR